jgi:tetratricopeptide (TPR) repeat protein
LYTACSQLALKEEIGIFEQLFISMQELLDEIALRYDVAPAAERLQLDEQLNMLKKMSDQFVEQWLGFEEKLAAFYAQDDDVKTPTTVEMESNDSNAGLIQMQAGFEKAQGFYKLYMFEHAVNELEKLIKQHPDDLLARMYLAMGYLRLGEDGDAYPHFQMILPLTDNNQLKAISYNAMGCIQVRKKNMQKAMEYFQMAYHSDPACIMEPLSVLGQTTISQQRLP